MALNFSEPSRFVGSTLPSPLLVFSAVLLSSCSLAVDRWPNFRCPHPSFSLHYCSVCYRFHILVDTLTLAQFSLPSSCVLADLASCSPRRAIAVPTSSAPTLPSLLPGFSLPFCLHARLLLIVGQISDASIRLSASTTTQSAIGFTSWLTVATLSHSCLSDEPTLPFLLLPSRWLSFLARSLLAFIYIYIVHIHTHACTDICTPTHTPIARTPTHAYIQACTPIHTHPHTHSHIHMDMYKCMQASTHTHTRI